MTSQKSSIYTSHSRSALKTYGFGALVLYACALSYCIITGKYFEAGLIGVVVAGLSILAITVFNSFSKEEQAHNDKSDSHYNQAA